MELGDGAFRLKKSFEAAERIARNIVILGSDEMAQQSATVKNFAMGTQTKVAFADLPAVLAAPAAL